MGAAGRQAARRQAIVRAGADAAAEGALGVFGRLLGEAFQLRDDVLGVFGDAERKKGQTGENLLKLLQVAAQGYDHVVIDLPRQIDPLTTTVLDFADIICVVMHQSLPHVRDARRLIGILTGELAIPANRIKVVVNRYQAEAAVGLKDIKSAIDAEMIVPDIENGRNIAAIEGQTGTIQPAARRLEHDRCCLHRRGNARDARLPGHRRRTYLPTGAGGWCRYLERRTDRRAVAAPAEFAHRPCLGRHPR